jgi:hypothetical protein
LLGTAWAGPIQASADPSRAAAAMVRACFIGELLA